MTYKISSPSGASRPRDSILYMSYCPSVHVLTSIVSVANTLYCCKHFILLLTLYTVANALYIIKLLYDSTVFMVTDTISV